MGRSIHIIVRSDGNRDDRVALYQEFERDSIRAVDRYGMELAELPLQFVKSQREVKRIEFEKLQGLLVGLSQRPNAFK